MKKKSQITVFIVLSLLIIGAILFFFIIKYNNSNDKKEVPIEVQPVNNFIQSCLLQTSIEGIDYVSKRGGYFETPKMVSESDIPYYFFEGKNYIISKKDLSDQISLYVYNMLDFCVNEFNEFPDLNVTQEQPKVNTIIEDNKVIINLEYPVNIIREDNSYSLKSFSAEIPVRLGIVYDSIDYFIQEQMINPDSICLSCLDDFTTRNNLKSRNLYYDDETVIFSFVDENSKLNGEDFVYNFANKYTGKKL